jgi:hypothetical protein
MEPREQPRVVPHHLRQLERALRLGDVLLGPAESAAHCVAPEFVDRPVMRVPGAHERVALALVEPCVRECGRNAGVGGVAGEQGAQARQVLRGRSADEARGDGVLDPGLPLRAARDDLVERGGERGHARRGPVAEQPVQRLGEPRHVELATRGGLHGQAPGARHGLHRRARPPRLARRKIEVAEALLVHVRRRAAVQQHGHEIGEETPVLRLAAVVRLLAR